MNPRFLTLVEFTNRYGLRRSSIYELINAVSLAAVKAGGKTLITYESAENWANSLPAMPRGTPARLRPAMAARGIAA